MWGDAPLRWAPHKMCRCVWRKGYVIGARGQRQVEQGRCTVIVTTSHDWQLRHSTRNNRDAEANRYVHNLENIIYNNLWRLFYIKLQNNKHLILTTFKRWNGDLQVSGRKTEQYISTSIWTLQHHMNGNILPNCVLEQFSWLIFEFLCWHFSQKHNSKDTKIFNATWCHWNQLEFGHLPVEMASSSALHKQLYPTLILYH